MDYRLLGPVEVRRAGRVVPLGGPRQRAVLVALLLGENDTVTLGHLCDAIWEVAPAAAESNVRTYIAQLRRLLHSAGEPGTWLETRNRGYRLLRAGGLDVVEVTGLVERGRQAGNAGDFTAAAWSFTGALKLWRGRPFADLEPGPPLRAERAGLEERHLIAVEGLARAKIELGEHEAVLAELRRLVAEHPTRETLAELLMLALYRCGQQADALAVFTDARRRLVTELGVEPGGGLRSMQERILAAEPAAAELPDVVSVHRQLPMDIVDFVGRDAELEFLYRQVDLAADSSVVISSVDGMAGVGKTRLAVHAAHELVRRGRFDELQLWADLRGFDPDAPPADPAGVLERFLTLLGVPPRLIPADLDGRAAMYRDRLAGRRALVLLDNAATEAQVRPLLPGTAGSFVLVTSRRTLADLDGVRPVHLDVFSTTEAVTLLARVAGESRIAAEAAAAARVVRLCGHLPIAVTIAAQRLRDRPVWTVEELSRRLAAAGDRLRQLHGRARAVQAAFGLSYQMLPARSRRVFRHLGLHPAEDFAAGSVAALVGIRSVAAEEILETLVDEHLLHLTAPGRYRPHDLLRLYARERAQLEDAEPDRDAALRRLLTWYLHTAATASRRLDPGGRPVPLERTETPREVPRFPTRTAALDWFDAERANLVSVVRAAADRVADEIAWQLPCALLSFYYLRKHWDDWVATHRVAIDSAARRGDDAARARVLNGLGVAYSDLGDLDRAIGCHTEAGPLFHAAADARGAAWNLNNLGVTYDNLGRYAEAADCYERALPQFSRAGDVHGESISLGNLGDAYRLLGQFERAAECLRRALSSQHRTNDRAAERFTLCSLGDLYQDTGQHGTAVETYRRALTISRELDDRRGVAKLLGRLADTLPAELGPEARECLLEACAILTELGDPEADAMRERLASTTPGAGPNS